LAPLVAKPASMPPCPILSLFSSPLYLLFHLDLAIALVVSQAAVLRAHPRRLQTPR
jgi:hypothetical protein